MHRATPIGTIAVEPAGDTRLDHPPAAPHAADDASLSGTLIALSHALELMEGHPMGHLIRSAHVAMRLASEVGLGEEERSALLHAMLLKDSGGSTVASRLAALFARDDREVKARVRLTERRDRVAFAVATLGAVAPRASLPAKLGHFSRITRDAELVAQVTRERADRAAELVAGLGLPVASIEAVRLIHEHWDGHGYPNGFAGDGIPLLARIANLAEAVDLHNARCGLDRTMRMVRARRGRWFDPDLADRVLSWSGDREWWRGLSATDSEERLLGFASPASRKPMGDTIADLVARTFADIVDAKSPFTERHSVLVASYADVIGEQYGLDEAARKQLRRAGLLHDIGKLAVSNRILDKAGGLAPEERQEMERHPLHTWEILSRVSAFRDLARLAALHHEKLDGSGYPWRIPGDRLPAAARVLVVADTIAALTADRPFRRGLPVDETIGILRRDRTTRLCARAVDAAEAVLESGKLVLGSEAPLARAGITSRGAGSTAAA